MSLDKHQQDVADATDAWLAGDAVPMEDRAAQLELLRVAASPCGMNGSAQRIFAGLVDMCGKQVDDLTVRELIDLVDRTRELHERLHP